MILHISQQRYNFIVSQGCRFNPIKYEGSAAEVVEIEKRLGVRNGDTEFHLLDDEYGFCEICRTPFDSIDANTAAELETIKLHPERASVALRNMRQKTAIHYKELAHAK